MCNETIEKGIDFERYAYDCLSEIAEPLLPMKTWEQRTGEYATGNFTPDLMFVRDGMVFYVDCHYRSYYNPKRMDLDYKDVYRRKMRSFRRMNVPIFELCGAGGEPYDPDFIMFKDLDVIHRNRLPSGSYSPCVDPVSRILIQLLMKMRGPRNFIQTNLSDGYEDSGLFYLCTDHKIQGYF